MGAIVHENPYSPPESAAEVPSSRPPPSAAGPLARVLAALVVMLVVPAAVVMAWNAESLYDVVTVFFGALMAFEFTHIVFTGWLYPKSLNA